MAIERYGKVIRIPPQGRLIVCTDLHGNLGDYRRVVAAFRQALEEDGDAYLLITGDLVHGPCYAEDAWPQHLGDYYPDQTVELLEEFRALREELPDRVESLIGNHEHSHVGGPHTRKFHKRPSETEFLEQTLGSPAEVERFHDLIKSFPILCVAGRGVVVTHGAPRLLEATFAEVCAVEYSGHEDKTINEMIQTPVLGELFWCRSSGPLAVRRFLERMQIEDQRNWVVVFGHDPVRRGYLREGEEQLCFSTSFGLRNAKKVYLDLDLSREYRSVRYMRYGVDVLPLYPAEAASRPRSRPLAARE